MSEQSKPAGPAGWLADPTGRHQHRYWNGTDWTDDVADQGATSVDPFNPPPKPAPNPAPTPPPEPPAAAAPASPEPALVPPTPTVSPVVTTKPLAKNEQPSSGGGIVALGVAFVVIVLALVVALVVLFSR